MLNLLEDDQTIDAATALIKAARDKLAADRALFEENRTRLNEQMAEWREQFERAAAEMQVLLGEAGPPMEAAAEIDFPAVPDAILAYSEFSDVMPSSCDIGQVFVEHVEDNAGGGM